MERTLIFNPLTAYKQDIIFYFTFRLMSQFVKVYLYLGNQLVISQALYYHLDFFMVGF